MEEHEYKSLGILWVIGSLGLWGMGLWVYGSMGLWVFGCMVKQKKQYETLRRPRSTRPTVFDWIREGQNGRKFVNSWKWPNYWSTLIGECGVGFFLTKALQSILIILSTKINIFLKDKLNFDHPIFY